MKPEVSVNHIAIPMTVSTKFVQNRDYDELENKPQINGVTLQGNKALEDLGIVIPTKVSDLDNDSGFITGDVIDDESSFGDTDKTWSADKLGRQFYDVLRTSNAPGNKTMADISNEGGVYNVGYTSGKLVAAIPWKNIRLPDDTGACGIKDQMQRAPSPTTQWNHYFYNTGILDIADSQTVGEIMMLVNGRPDISSYGVSIPQLYKTAKLFDVATTQETQAIINEWEASNA